MALTRKMLAAMDIPAEKIDEIITAHTETVNAIKEERDSLKVENDNLKNVEKDLEKANEKIKEFESGDWENKYNAVKGEYDNFKTETETKATKTAKTNAYKQLLIDAGVSAKRVDSILKVSESNINDVELDENGKIKDADKLSENVKTEWADFIVDTQTQGANTPKPPASEGDGQPNKPSRAAQMVAQYRNEHYGKEED